MIYFKTLIHELHGSKMAINIYNDAFRFTVHNAYLKFKKNFIKQYFEYQILITKPEKFIWFFFKCHSKEENNGIFLIIFLTV